MTAALVERWDDAGAPQGILGQVRAAFESYFGEVEQYETSRERFRLDARDAVELGAAREAYDRWIAELGGGPRWSTIATSFKALLDKFGRRGWNVCWPTINQLAKVWQVRKRQAWEKVRALCSVGLLQKWSRYKTRPEAGEGEGWHETDPDAPEARSNVYVIKIPIGLLEMWRELKARRRGTRVAAPETSSAPRSRSPSKASSPSNSAAPRPAAWLPALFHEVRGADKRYQGEGPTPGAEMAAGRVAEVEQLFAGQAQEAVNDCIKNGASALPDVAQVARELARLAVRQYLREAGSNDFLAEHRHAFRYLYGDAAKLARAARPVWLRRWMREHPAAPPACDEAPPEVRRMARSLVQPERAQEAAPPRAPSFLGLSGAARVQQLIDLTVEEERARKIGADGNDNPTEHLTTGQDGAQLEPELADRDDEPPE